MAAITKSKRPLEEPQEERKVKATKTKKQASPTSPADYTTIMASQLALIEASNRTPFEKRVWSLLCQIPSGSFSTYGIMAAHLKSSPRAVGNALRRNPFAPEVPCHRVVATGGALGGFKGKWPKDGEGITLDEKRRLLRGEGVRWDDKGKVIGTPFGGFT
ncbi:methylated-DNA cysteine methyltransferase [Fusarium beomiforme]|uniref:Methylated-DNA--protein-cysteine methyltransferase n=1 Tax=Fusarium beomiforme TaxID=44412 RepID=A0A9P5AFG7_9HYPO|nr:methylated-DNA cysteine methyltransferase [Fusarium beomiforme]